MSQHHPFQFSAGSGQSSAAQTGQNHTQPSNMPSQHTPQPSMDMSVLEGVSPEQLAAIARLFQSGALQMPPPVPTLSTQVSAPPRSAPTVIEDVSIPVPSDVQPVPSVNRDEMDTEEGEVNESEPDNVPVESREFLRPPPTGPKNRSVSPRERKQRKPSPRPRLSSTTMATPSQSQHDSSSQRPAVANGMRAVAKNDAAKEFVLEMVKAGYSYNDIASEVRNEQSLIRMFRDLDIPVTAPQSSPQLSHPIGTATVHSQAPAPATNTSAHEQTRKASLAKPQAPIKPAPKDRKEYLAQLQAAKTKKADAAPEDRKAYLARLHAAQTKRPGTAGEQSAGSKDPRKLESAPTVSVSNQMSGRSQPPDSNEKATQANKPLPSNKAAMNELLRQKMQALKAQQAAKQIQGAASSSNDMPPVLAPVVQETRSPARDGLGAGLANISSQLAQGEAKQPLPLQASQPDVQLPAAGESTISPTPRTPSTSFGSLPGLFMFGNHVSQGTAASPSQSAPLARPPAQLIVDPTIPQEASTASSRQPRHIEPIPGHVSTLRKRPVASDFDDTPARPGPVKRLFGQSRNASEDESLVIEVSDAEEDGDEVEPEPVPRPSSKTTLQTKSFRDVAPLRDFPPNQTLQVQTSAPGTPGGITYEQKMKEIEEFKRKIAEKERRQKANGKPVIFSDGAAEATILAEATTTASAMPSSLPTEVHGVSNEASSLEQSDVDQSQAEADTHSRSISTDQHVSAIQSAKQQEKERLRQKLLELEREEDIDDDDVDDDVEVEDVESDEYSPISEPEHTVPGATLAASYSTPEGVQEQSMEIKQQGLQRDAEENASVSEEGELTDDSMSHFYDVEDTQHVVNQEEPQSHQYERYPQTPSSTGSDTTNALTSGIQVPSMPGPAPVLLAETEDQPSHLPNEEVEMELDADDDILQFTPNGSPLEDPATATGLEDIADDTFAGTTGKASGAMANAGVSEASLEGSSFEEDLANEPFISNPELAETRDVDMADDDLAPEIQPAQDDEMAFSGLEPTQPKHFFTPYRSPLQGFKDYRYHPEYLDTVPGGHRSATYTYNIDPETSMCPHETASEKCNDSNCPYQHFGSLVLSDTELLKNMGTKHVPANTPDELKRWNEGLAQVVRQLRNTNLSKDANAIAARIAEYRREFVGDATKILNLG